MWIFKGALYYLYTLDDCPTFKDLYRILDSIARKVEAQSNERVRKERPETPIHR